MVMVALKGSSSSALVRLVFQSYADADADGQQLPTAKFLTLIMLILQSQLGFPCYLVQWAVHCVHEHGVEHLATGS
jgi:hypothetical protein